MKLIKAIFKGQDGSCGYRTDKEYILILCSCTNFIQIQNENGGGGCDYESTVSFLENWDNIRRIDKQEIPKSLKPEELVDGEIYTAKEGTYVDIFRFRNLCRDERPSTNSAYFYSSLHNGSFKVDCWLVFSDRERTCCHATLSEKQTLIKAEIEHGYFHELKNQK